MKNMKHDIMYYIVLQCIKTPSMLFRSMTSNTCLMHGHKQSIMVTRAHFLGHPSPPSDPHLLEPSKNY